MSCKTIFFFGHPPLGEKGSYNFTTVSMLLGKHVFSKMAHRIFLKRFMKLGSQIFGENLILGIMPKNIPKIGFWILQKKKKKGPLMCRFFGFKSCTIMNLIILLKRHVWEKSGSQVKCKNALGQSECRIFKL